MGLSWRAATLLERASTTVPGPPDPVMYAEDEHEHEIYERFAVVKGVFIAYLVAQVTAVGLGLSDLCPTKAKIIILKTK